MLQKKIQFALMEVNIFDNPELKCWQTGLNSFQFFVLMSEVEI